MNRTYDDWDPRDRQTFAELSREEAKLVARIDEENAGARKKSFRSLADFPRKYGLLIVF